MRNPIPEKRSGPTDGDVRHHWYQGFDDEQFIHLAGSGWYVESREGEFGPFQSRKDAEDFYYSRFRHL